MSSPIPPASTDDTSSSSSSHPPSSTSSSINRNHDPLERRSSKSRLSKQDEVEMTEDVAVTPCDTSGDVITDAGGGDVIDDGRTNGATSCGVADVSDSTGGDAIEAEEAGTDDEATVGSDGLARGSDGVTEVVTIRLEAQRSVDSDSGCSVQALNAKVKLVRCSAVYDDASPPPEGRRARSPVVVMETTTTDGADPGGFVAPSAGGQSSLTVSPTMAQTRPQDRLRLAQGSSQGSTVSDGGPSPAMSRASSIDTSYTDSTGTNLEEFIVKTLNKNRNDRSMLMRLEAEMTAFINDMSKDKWKFPQMSSYHRMLVHRVAAFFGLDHNIDDSGKCVVVNRQPTTRIPDFKFRDHIHDDLSSGSNDDQPKKSILKRHRDCTSLEENLGVDRISLDDRKSKSFEERTEEYMEARSRIFKEENVPSECKVNELSVGREEPDSRNKDELRWRSDVRQWRSTDSSGYSTDESSRLRVGVTKASSFHGVMVLTRGDSHTSTMSSGSRFSKTDSISSGVSNLGSPIVIPPTIPSSPPAEGQTAGGALPSGLSIPNPYGQHQWHAGGDGPSTEDASPFLPFKDDSGEPLAIWVASTIGQIPPGSIIINPHTREPYKNRDGSLFRWYPPPPEKEPPGESETEAPARRPAPEAVSEAPRLSGRGVGLHQPAERTQDSKDSSHRTSFSTSFKSSSSIQARTHTASQSVVATTPPSLVISTRPASASNISSPYSGITTMPSTSLVPSSMTTHPPPPFGATPNQMYVVVPSGKYQVAPPAPQMYMAPSVAPTPYCPVSTAGPVHPVRYACLPQGLSYQGVNAPPPTEQPSPVSAPETPRYSYMQPPNPYATPDAFQMMGYAPQTTPDAIYQQPSLTFGAQQPQQPYALVPQYADKVTWNQYAPMSMVPGGRGPSVAYYTMDSTGQGSVPSGVQLVVVSSASGSDLTHGGAPVMYGQPPSAHPSQMVPSNDARAYVGAGAPQYVHYTYQAVPAHAAQASAVQLMPCYPNVLTVPGPGAPGVGSVRGPTPGLVPVTRPTAAPQSFSRRSPSPKSIQFPVAPTQSGGLVRMMPAPEHHLGMRPPEMGFDHPRPLLARQPRFAPRVRSAVHNNIAFRPPVIVNTGDSRCSELPMQRMAHPRSLPPTFLHRPRMMSGGPSDTASVPVPNDPRKCLVTQPRQGASASEACSAVLEVCALPPVLQRCELDSYLNDLTVFGAKRFYVQDDVETTPSSGSKDMTCVGSAAAVVAVFDSVANAQRALHEQSGGKRYRLQATSRTYDPNQPQRS